MNSKVVRTLKHPPKYSLLCSFMFVNSLIHSTNIYLALAKCQALFQSPDQQDRQVHGFLELTIKWESQI